MGRMMPMECEHGKVYDWGAFGLDPDDSSVGIEECPECDEQYSMIVRALKSARRRAREAKRKVWR